MIDVMATPLHKPWTVSEFLAWEERQSSRFEFDGAEPVAMVGGTMAHDAIKVNLSTALVSRLRGTPCRPHGGDLKIEAAGSIRYPDGFVTCTPGAPGDKVERDPVVIFEVLSQSTAATDIVVKNREYAATPSVRRYILLAQDVMGGTMYERIGDDWVGHVLGPDSLLRMPEIDVAVPLGELYEGVELSPPSTEDERPG
jgi:Uma2 family endonuclease